MKKRNFIAILIIIFTIPSTVYGRSEITGYISTDPSRPDEDIGQDSNDDGSIVELPDEPILEPEQSRGGSSLVFLNNKTEKPKLISKEEIANNNIEKPIVLGFDRLIENTLVRDESGRIYIIKGEIKKVIWDLVELREYKDKPILDLADSELSEYPTRRFFDNKLIRKNNTEKVYVVRNGTKQYVKNLEELASKFFGQKIYNVGKEEFVLYF